MEFQKIVNFLGMTSYDKDLPRFLNKNDQTGGSDNVNKEIRITTPMLRSDLCDFSDVYIVAALQIHLGSQQLLRVLVR